MPKRYKLPGDTFQQQFKSGFIWGSAKNFSSVSAGSNLRAIYKQVKRTLLYREKQIGKAIINKEFMTFLLAEFLRGDGGDLLPVYSISFDS